MTRAVGLNRILRYSAWRNARLAILCYHGVSLDDEHLALPQLYVTVAQLRHRFTLLRRDRYVVLPLDEALRRLMDGTLPPRSVALTFDDGTRDFATLVAPLLEEFGYPATVYLTTYYSTHPWPVFNTAMRYMLWRGRDSGVDLSDVFGVPVRLEAGGMPPWPTLLESVTAAGFTGAEKQTALETVTRRVGVDVGAFLAGNQFAIMTSSQVAALPRPFVDVQLHTHRHRVPLNAALFHREILENRHFIQQSLGSCALTHFCYPSGVYDATFLPWLRDLGVRWATTCDTGLASPRSNPLLLPRLFDTSVTSELAFLAGIEGATDWMPRRDMWRARRPPRAVQPPA